MEKNVEKPANSKIRCENPEDTEPAAHVLARALDDMEVLGLIVFKADAAGGGCWVVAEQKSAAEPMKQDVKEAA